MAKYLDYTGLTAVVKYLTPQAGEGISISKNENNQNVISCTLNSTVFKIVESLPTGDIDENVIYVVPAGNTGENNIYVEYIYVNGAWEKLGEFQAETDLSNYYTKTLVDELIAAAQLAIDNEETEIQEIFSTMLTKSEATSTYQERLSEGDNITISNNVISAVDTTYTGGDNVSISSSNVISVDLSSYAKSSDLSDYVTSSDLTSTLGDYLTTSTAASTYQEKLTASASGEGDLSLSASISNGNLTITGSVDIGAITGEEIDALFE